MLVKKVSMGTSKGVPTTGRSCNSHLKDAAISAANNATAMGRVSTVPR